MPEKESDTGRQLAIQAHVKKQYVRKRVPGVESTSEETIAIHRFVTEPAKVDVNYSLTLNLDNYEFARLTVGMTVPCYKEEADDAFNWAANWVSERLKAEVKNIRSKSDTSIV